MRPFQETGHSGKQLAGSLGGREAKNLGEQISEF